ncbi:hypothetical protein ALCH109712_09285 [Alkalicoccus chagannorensis]
MSLVGGDARTFREGKRRFSGWERTFSGPGRSLSDEQRSFRRWADVQQGAADVQRGRAVTQNLAADTPLRASTSTGNGPYERKKAPDPFSGRVLQGVRVTSLLLDGVS